MAKLPSRVNGSIDLTKGSLPVLIVVSLLVLATGFAYGLGSFVTELRSQTEQDQRRFVNIDAELKTIRGLIENGQFVRKSEFDSWCRNAEIINKGFKCGNTK